MTNDNHQDIERLFHNDLKYYLTSKGMVDTRLPEAPDLEELWTQICKSYLPDGIREFANYPTASIGWMMFIGMAVAKYWDVEWDVYSKVPDLYKYLLSKSDFDNLDDYICTKILYLDDNGHKEINDIVAECASRTYNILLHQHIEPGTPEAFKAYVAAIHQMYVMGFSVELKALGYHMTKM